jgi:hypothetical protein
MDPLAVIPHILPKEVDIDNYGKIYIVFDWSFYKSEPGRHSHCSIVAIGTKNQIEEKLNMEDFQTYEGGAADFRFVEVSNEQAYSESGNGFTDWFDSGILSVDDEYTEVDEKTGKEFYFPGRKFDWVPNGTMNDFDFGAKIRERAKKAKAKMARAKKVAGKAGNKRK